MLSINMKESSMVKTGVMMACIMMVPMLAGAHSSCYPAPQGRQQFVIGYGSLMNSESRMRTVPRADRALPVILRGWQRGFFTRSLYRPGTTFLGVKRAKGGRLVAVYFALDGDDIKRLDRREGSYCRRAISRQQLTALTETLPKGQYWLYVPMQPAKKANRRYPIVQSYVDLFLIGCMQQQRQYHLQGFAVKCVQQTTGWRHFWVNDRIMPRRPFIHQPEAFAVDRLLLQELGGAAVHGRVIE
jgi:hypothetical protein